MWVHFNIFSLPQVSHLHATDLIFYQECLSKNCVFNSLVFAEVIATTLTLWNRKHFSLFIIFLQTMTSIGLDLNSVPQIFQFGKVLLNSYNYFAISSSSLNCRSPDFKGPMGPTKIWRGTIIGWSVVRLVATLGPAGYNRLIPF